jgi:hypothetical protein
MEVSPTRHKRRQALAKGSDAAINKASFEDFMRDVEKYFKLAKLNEDGQCVAVRREAIVDEVVLCLLPVPAKSRDGFDAKENGKKGDQSQQQDDGESRDELVG